MKYLQNEARKQKSVKGVTLQFSIIFQIRLKITPSFVNFLVICPLNSESVSSNISYKSFKIYNLPMQNSYCDHRNFDSVNQAEGMVKHRIILR
jgi:hypothetical protein